jgi:hypothetical protein
LIVKQQCRGKGCGGKKQLTNTHRNQPVTVTHTGFNMKSIVKLGALACLIVASLAITADSNAQGLYNGLDAEGFTTTNATRFVRPRRTLRYAASDHFSPHRVYAYSNQGIRAGQTHQWNQEQAMGRTWHGNYGHWRHDQPTALVVPANASYQMSYGWGVGQNRSYPIHHQFGRSGPGIMGGGVGGFQRTPLFPSHSDQMGVYSVRAPF